MSDVIDKPATVKIWVTKYALTTGVTVHDAFPTSYEMMRIMSPGGRSFSHVHKGGYATTEADALIQVQKLADTKRKSLDKARDKVQAIADAVRRGKLPMAKS